MFNVIAFVIPFSRGAGYWTGYGFSTLSILIAAGVGMYAVGREGMRSKFYGLPLALVVWYYLVVQLIFGLLMMAVPIIPFWAGIVVSTVLLGACLIGLIGVNAGKGMVERVGQKVREKVFYIRSLQADIESLADRAADESLQKELKTLAEAVRYSDPMSSPLLASLENKIEAKAAELAGSITDAVAASAVCAELRQLLAERNRKCKLLKCKYHD
ncbi:MAG: hypothetical protein LBC70_10925 [Chitinispirillales bacterium]|nr:hypothetical protein [Chitinispirillales bacterium]